MSKLHTSACSRNLGHQFPFADQLNFVAVTVCLCDKHTVEQIIRAVLQKYKDCTKTTFCTLFCHPKSKNSENEPYIDIYIYYVKIDVVYINLSTTICVNNIVYPS